MACPPRMGRSLKLDMLIEMYKKKITLNTGEKEKRQMPLAMIQKFTIIESISCIRVLFVMPLCMFPGRNGHLSQGMLS